MESNCYGFFSKTSFGGQSKMANNALKSSQPENGKIINTHTSVIRAVAQPLVALNVPPSVNVPVTRKTLPLNYIFGSEDGLGATDGKRRSLKQSIYGKNDCE